MHNPWLGVPLRDYEGHMGSPAVAQLPVLAELFEEVLRHCRPGSLAILGVAGGNGLDRIDADVTKRVVGVDIHEAYLEAARERHPGLPLKLVRADLRNEDLTEEAVELVHAALIFEHAGIERCLSNALSLVSGQGYLSVVLQLPSASEANVSPTAFSSMQALRGLFQIVDREEFQARLLEAGFTPLRERRCELPGGKAFWLGLFQRS